MDSDLSLEFLRVVERAAIACAHTMGQGDGHKSDQAAVEAMRQEMDTVPIDGTVVIGEGERDEAPMLFIGEKIGMAARNGANGRYPKVDIAVDPLEGTTLCATGTPNARAAHETLREIQAIITAAGVPPRAVSVRQYQPKDPRHMAAIRLNYPKISATAGPCGLWPEDLGPSYKNRSYFENKSYYNFGCAHQRNLAAMIDEPSDLVQPRAESPAYTMRRNVAFEKYRKGTSTATTYPEAEKAKLSDTGK